MKFLVDIGFQLWDRLFSSEATRRRRRIDLIEGMLADRTKAKTGIRSLKELTLKTGMSDADCRALLSEIGCEGVTMQDGGEGWRKIKDNT